MTDRYTALRNVLEAAFAQAATGKGAERHANGEDWTKQPIFTIAQQVGDGFNAGQVIKKVQEAQQMAARGEFQRAQHEVLGAIVYAASLHVLWKPDTRAAQGDERRYFPLLDWSGGRCPVDPETLVRVQLRNAETLSAPCKAGNLLWYHSRRGGDIIRYGVVKQAPSVKEINEFSQQVGRVPPEGKVPNCKCATKYAQLFDEPNRPWPIDPPILTRWQGGEMPVKLGDRVKLWLRSGEIIVTSASVVSWKHFGGRDDILAFELVDAA